MNGSCLPSVPAGHSGPAALIVRHAERHPIPDLRSALEVGLTEKGKGDARDFGSLLRGFETVRVFHSPALRCRETSEGIMEGVRGNGTSVQGLTEIPGLCAPYIRDPRRILGEAGRLGSVFLRQWFDGKYGEDLIMPSNEAADLVLSQILARLAEPGGDGRLDVHVSHDWEILLLREMLMGARYEEDGWIGYLEGIMFVPDGDGFLALMNGRSGRFRYRDGRRVD
ncbi:histidine phosphatase family protein [Methanomassiliicoccus luminyensis]|jgi:hypothetical protein|uniref:histidine phosphatase family protein n=1 Tax=Methanomassiliicoccus luminyensis TaxID=1080712 RepID=UPI00036804CC|nr:histidine phosphatase family protein [Methanomassiliicoccus luminyensis]